MVFSALESLLLSPWSRVLVKLLGLKTNL